MCKLPALHWFGGSGCAIIIIRDAVADDEVASFSMPVVGMQTINCIIPNKATTASIL